MWATTTSEIPETYDEKNIREAYEKRGAKDRDAVLAMALARIAGVELPDSLTRMISGMPAHVPGTVECPNGHGQPSGMKFCGECGSAMHGVPTERALPASVKAAGPLGESTPKEKMLALRDARKDDLIAMCRERSMDDSGNRAQMIARLAAAGVTSADYTRFMQVAA